MQAGKLFFNVVGLCVFTISMSALVVGTFGQAVSRNYKEKTKQGLIQNSGTESKRKDAIVYFFLFQHINELAKLQKGYILLKKSGLADRSFENLKEHSFSFTKEAETIDQKADKIIAEYRKRFPLNKLSKGDSLPVPPRQLFVLQEEKDKTVLKYRDKVKSDIGESEFSKLIEYVETNIQSRIIKKTGGDADQNLTNRTRDKSGINLFQLNNDGKNQSHTLDSPLLNIVENFDTSASLIPPDPNTYYQIVSSLSGKCLDVIGGPGATANGIRLQQYSCFGQNQTNQLWRFEPDGNGYKIIAANSGKCLDIYGGQTNDTAPIQQWDCLGNVQQSFRLVEVGNTYQIVAGHSDKCLDVTGGSGATGNELRIQQYSCFGQTATNQLWTLRTPSPSESQPNVYNYSSANYDDSTNTVYGYAATQTDYAISLYYEPKVQATLKDDSGNVLGYAENTGNGNSASVILTAGDQDQECGDFFIEAVHTLLTIYIYVVEEPYYYEWYDPYDFYYYSSDTPYYFGYGILDPWDYWGFRTIAVQAFVVSFTEYIVRPSLCEIGDVAFLTASSFNSGAVVGFDGFDIANLIISGGNLDVCNDEDFNDTIRVKFIAPLDAEDILLTAPHSEINGVDSQFVVYDRYLESFNTGSKNGEISFKIRRIHPELQSRRIKIKIGGVRSGGGRFQGRASVNLVCN